MDDWRNSDDPNRSERERRQDARAWELIGGFVERGSWHQINRAVAKAVPKAREQGLLDATWKVYLFDQPASDGDRPYVTIEPSGRWELGSETAEGEHSTFASSERPGVYQTSSAHGLMVSIALKRALGDDRFND